MPSSPPSTKKKNYNSSLSSYDMGGWWLGWWVINEEQRSVTCWDITMTYHIIFDDSVTLTTAYDRVSVSRRSNQRGVDALCFLSSSLEPSPPHLSLSNIANVTNDGAKQLKCSCHHTYKLESNKQTFDLFR